MATAKREQAPVLPPGMDASGEVLDSAMVEPGYGQKVKGAGGWEGEITGRPAPASKFTRISIGMSMNEVIELIGPPSDKGVFAASGAGIPGYFGSDRYRQALIYSGQGRLIFAGGAVGDSNSAYLTWIVHNPRERAYR